LGVAELVGMEWRRMAQLCQSASGGILELGHGHLLWLWRE
jgi:hypothetical protein